MSTAWTSKESHCYSPSLKLCSMHACAHAYTKKVVRSRAPHFSEQREFSVKEAGALRLCKMVFASAAGTGRQAD